MKQLLLAAALVGFAACANTTKDTVGSAEAANAPKAECTGECSNGGACCSEGTECTAEKAAAEVCPVTGKAAVEVCPVTGKPASN